MRSKSEGDLSSIHSILVPGEKILSECRPFYATSRRIIRYDESSPREQVSEVDYQQITAVEIIRKPSHPTMLLGTLCVLAALFLGTTGFLIVTAVPAAIGGIALVILGARGKLGYYQLHIRKQAAPVATDPDGDLGSTMVSFVGSLGLRTPPDQLRWRLDYYQAGSFIATVRNVLGELPEV